MKTSITLVGFVILFFILGLTVNHLKVNYTSNEIIVIISNILHWTLVGLGIAFLGCFIWLIAGPRKPEDMGPFF